MAYTAAVITISDKGYRGEREDTSGPNLEDSDGEGVRRDLYRHRSR